MSHLHDADPLLALAVVLVVGTVFGAAARRIQLPSVTGQIVGGVLLGPQVLDVLSGASIDSLTPVTHFALGFMAVTVGAHLNVRRLRNAGRRLAILLVAEVLLAPLLIGLALIDLTSVDAATATLLATLGLSTAPATIVAVVSECRAKGTFTRTLVGAVALNNVACIVLFEAARAAARVELDPAAGHSIANLVLAPATQLVTALAIGGGVGLIAHQVTRGVHDPARLGTIGALALLLAVGLSRWAEVSPLLACVILGCVQTNLTPRREKIADRVFQNMEPVILAVFFTLAGMHLSFEHAAQAGVVAVVFFGARAAAKVVAAGLAMRIAGATRALQLWLGVALLPQAGVAVGLVILVQDDPVFVGISDVFVAVVLTVVTLNEIVGPMATRHALVRAGERDRDRPRLIDFLGEHAIVTDLRAETLEEAIEVLTDALIRAHHLRDVSRRELLASVLEREAEASTMVGGGLAIPHGELAHGDHIVGVLGLAREGLPFAGPDGEPVRLIVLLATPHAQLDRHLAVLAALARSLGRDDRIRDRLVNAGSAAHAYEILHDEEAESFNVFLD